MKDTHNIIVSLDGMSERKALSMAQELHSDVWGFKVNDLLYEYSGIIEQLKELGCVFADVKLHDIPNTVGNSVQRLVDRGVDIITVHASGGLEMMSAAKQHAGPAKIIAVTVLTSQNTAETESIVLERARDAIAAGVDGIVCSGQELGLLDTIEGMKEKLKVVPGIRPSWYREKDDQARTVTPHEAIKNGANYLVVGRPITTADNPADALQKVYQ